MSLNLISKFLPRTRASNPVSKLLRGLLEKSQVRSFLGGVLVITTFVLGVSLYPPREPVRAWGEIEDIEVITQRGVVFRPLPNTTGISQGYHLFHRGIDLRAPQGSSIYPLKPGRVTLVRHTTYGYGRHVIIDHGDGLTTLYAHVGKIFVEEGEEVDENTVIAEVGLTGRTTGYHLHFEVRKGLAAVNPLGYLN